MGQLISALPIIRHKQLLRREQFGTFVMLLAWWSQVVGLTQQMASPR